MKLVTASWQESLTNLDSELKSKDITFLTKVSIVKVMAVPVVTPRMWELDSKEGTGLRNWWFWIVVLEKTLESPLNSKEIKPVNTKGNQPWILIGKTDAEAPKLWPSNAKSRFTGKDPDSGKDRRQKERRWQRMRWLDSTTTNSMDMNLGKLPEMVGNREAR